MLAAGSACAVASTGAQRTEDSITGFTEQQFLQQAPFGHLEQTRAASVCTILNSKLQPRPTSLMYKVKTQGGGSFFYVRHTCCINLISMDPCIAV